MIRNLLAIALAVALVTCWQRHAVATVVFSDTFDRVMGSGDGNFNPLGMGNGVSDWGSNNNALGGFVTQTYTFGQGRAGGANQTTGGNSAQIIAGGVQIETDFAAIASAGFVIEFDFQRVVDHAGTNASNGFLAVAIGLDDTDLIESREGFNDNTFVWTNEDNGADAAIAIRQDTTLDPSIGTAEFWSGGSMPEVTLDGFYNNPHDTTHSATITVDAPSGYGAGAQGTISLSIDGGPAFGNSFTFDGVSSGYISLFSNIAGSPTDIKFAQLENLVITGLGTITNPGLPGDFNDDGIVDAADYAVWRDNLGGDSSSLNGNGAGGATVTSADYDLWRLSFGDGSSAALGTVATAVPEPAAIVLLGSLFVAGVVARFSRFQSPKE